jgi:hypothetical protein
MRHVLVPLTHSFIIDYVFPEHKWLPWKFEVTPTGFWSEIENRRMFVHWFAEEKGLSRLEQWYEVSTSDIRTAGGMSLVAMHGESLIRLLREAYPDHEWLPWLFKKSPSSDWSLSKGLSEAQAKQFADCA